MTYRSRKSPASWRGSYAEQLIDLSAVNEAQIFFEGSAREAARLFPAMPTWRQPSRWAVSALTRPEYS